MLPLKAGSETDWTDVLSLIQRSFAYMETATGQRPRVMTMTPESLQREAQDGSCWLIYNSGKVIACLFTRPSRDNPRALFLSKIAVAESHRGQGLARRLVETAAQEAHAKGFDDITLDTGSALTELHRLYQSYGFSAPVPRKGARGEITMIRAHLQPIRVGPPYDWAAILVLIQKAFAGMEGRIDPPSSMHRLTEHSIAQQAETGEVWVIEDNGPVACVFLTPLTEALYLGKLATAETHRRLGLGAKLIETAKRRAQALKRPVVELESRIELVEVHHFFASQGFTKTGETAHEGYDRPTSITMRLQGPTLNLRQQVEVGH